MMRIFCFVMRHAGRQHSKKVSHSHKFLGGKSGLSYTSTMNRIRLTTSFRGTTTTNSEGTSHV